MSLRNFIRQEIQQLKEDDDPCWKGYQQIGMKDKDGRQVPNCVPESYDVWNEEKGVGYT